MAKNKLSKFADMASFPHVFEPVGAINGVLPDFSMKGNWHKDFFKNNNPIVLELGCGRGEYTVELAELYPNKNFIGVDIKGARMWTGAKDSLNKGLKNVAFLRTHIEFIDQYFAANEVAEIWLTFSDPQMKKVTKRLTSTFFMNRYRNFLCNNGLIHLKTDSNFLFTYTKYMLKKNNLENEACFDDLYHNDLSWYPEMNLLLNIQTYYEQQWIQRGLTIKYLRFRLPQAGELEEPNIEIPLDEYRSYNRNKRSELETSK